MADAVSEQQSLPMREEEALVIARRKAAEKVPRHRFGLAYLLLAALLGAGVGLFVVFVSGNGKSGGQEWSAWKPTQSGVQRFDQIAKNVGARVRAADRPPARRGALDTAGRPGAEHPGSAAGDCGADGARRRDLQ